MSEPQFDAKFGEVYQGIDSDGHDQDLIVMVIGVMDFPGELIKDYNCIWLVGSTGLDLWGLFTEHWRRVDDV